MADTCPFCGPLGTFAGKPTMNLNCPHHGPHATSMRAVEAPGLTNAAQGVCEQHPDAPVTLGICRTCADDAISAAIINPVPDLVVPFTATFEGPLTGPPYTFEKLAEAVRAIRPVQRARQHPDTVRRDRYAAAIRNEIKAATIPSGIPGGAPTFGANEFEIADAALALADNESAQLLAERNAALRLAEVWADAPDPACRAMAADLRSAIRGARAARLLDCGWCYEENGEEVHPHPECPIGRPAADTGVTIPAALTAPAPEEKARQLAAEATAARCGDTATGAFGGTLGPCLNDPGHETEYHRDARGAEWSYYGTPAHRRELARQLALAIHRYDYEHLLTVNDIPGEHHRGEAAAVLTAVEKFLDLGEAEAWCKSCRRVWEGRSHLCESNAEQQLAALHEEHTQLGARVEQLMRTLHALYRFNQLTADSCRVQAAEHARDNLEILAENLPVPVHLAAGSARAEFLNLCAQWGLTTGRGSREIVARILQHSAHEAAEDLRAWARSGDRDAYSNGSVENVLWAADRIDPYSIRYAGAQN